MRILKYCAIFITGLAFGFNVCCASNLNKDYTVGYSVKWSDFSTQLIQDLEHSREQVVPYRIIPENVRDTKSTISREIANRPGMFGRLIIPSADIDVALIKPASPYQNQAVTDAADSAALMIGQYSNTSKVIADHNHQAFSTLKNVSVGDSAYIVTGDDIIYLHCSNVIDGHNDGFYIYDSSYNKAADISEFVCYTCKECWQNIRIVGFDRD